MVSKAALQRAARLPHRPGLAWAGGMFAALACALALIGILASGDRGMPSFHAEAVEVVASAEAAACEVEKDTLDRDWALVTTAPLASCFPLSADSGVRKSRPQFQAPPPQRPPRA